MKLVIDAAPAYFGKWMESRGGPKWFPGRGSIVGLIDWKENPEPLCACLFEGHNGASIMLHIMSDGTRRWMNREFLWFVFYYPFEQLKVNKIIAPVETSNLTCARFVEHIGFTLEATLQDCAPNGDLLIYTMSREQCRWLALGSGYRGELSVETPSTATA